MRFELHPGWRGAAVVLVGAVTAFVLRALYSYRSGWFFSRYGRPLGRRRRFEVYVVFRVLIGAGHYPGAVQVSLPLRALEVPPRPMPPGFANPSVKGTPLALQPGFPLWAWAWPTEPPEWTAWTEFRWAR